MPILNYLLLPPHRNISFFSERKVSERKPRLGLKKIKDKRKSRDVNKKKRKVNTVLAFELNPL